MTTNRTPWTPAENAALVRLYFDMLDNERSRHPYTKAALIRIAQGANTVSDGQSTTGAGFHYVGQLANRSRGSVEAKLMNASAAHAKLRPYDETMDGHGYRALSNYQAALEAAMLAEIEHREKVEARDNRERSA